MSKSLFQALYKAVSRLEKEINVETSNFNIKRIQSYIGHLYQLTFSQKNPIDYWRQVYSEQTLVDLFRRFDTCGGSKKTYPQVHKKQPDLVLKVDKDIINRISRTLMFYYKKYYQNESYVQQKSGFFLKEKSDEDNLLSCCNKNLDTLITQCYQSPYLRVLTPLYIFLYFKTQPTLLFNGSILLKNVDIYSLSKQNKPLFKKNPYADMSLMLELSEITQSQYHLFLQAASLEKKGGFEDALLKSFVKNETDVILPISPFLMIPCWPKILIRLASLKRIGSQEANNYLEKICSGINGATPCPDGLDPEVWKCIIAFHQLCLPHNCYAFLFNYQVTSRFKYYVASVYDTLYPKDSNQEKEDLDSQLSALVSDKYFETVDINLLAFLRITRYIPTQGCTANNLDTICGALDSYLIDAKMQVLSAFFFHPISPSPIEKSSFNIAHQFRHVIFEKWESEDTKAFCTKLLPKAQDRYDEFERHANLLKNGVEKKEAAEIERIFSMESDKAAYDSVAPYFDPDLEMFRFIHKIAQRKKNTKSLALDYFNPSNPDYAYLFYSILEQCIDCCIFDLRNQFWTCQYDVADALYPLRQKQETKSQKDKLLEGKQVGKV